MDTKSEKKNKDDNKTKNPNISNPITSKPDKDMHKPVRGLPDK